jgi:hypothetical protein
LEAQPPQLAFVAGPLDGLGLNTFQAKVFRGTTIPNGVLTFFVVTQFVLPLGVDVGSAALNWMP